jgi:hypothetical protein
MWKEATMDYFNLPPQQLPGANKENHQFSIIGLRPKISNPGPQEYETDVPIPRLNRLIAVVEISVFIAREVISLNFI